MKRQIKAGDQVVVISGSHRHKTGRVLRTIKSKNRAVVEGVAMIKKHEKKTQENPEGAIVEREGSINITNLMLADKFNARRQKKGLSPVLANSGSESEG